MLENSSITLNYYLGGVKTNTPSGTIDFKRFLDSITNPKESSIQLQEQIALASAKGNKKLKTELKEKLPFVTPSILVDKYRRYDNIKTFTGLAQIDFDGCNKPHELRTYLFNQYPQFYAVYLSPSGLGVKGLIRIPICRSVEEFKSYYSALEEEFEGIYGFDPSPKNAVLPLFYSIDYFALTRENPEIWDKKIEPKKNIRDLVKFAPRPYSYTKENERNGKRALNTVRKMIRQINSEGHPQLRSACLILGTRVGAGYLTRSDAEREVEYLIRENSYLQKGIKGYITTSLWAIDEGFRSPNFY